MVLCFASKCNHKSGSGFSCKFKRFPKDVKARKCWEERCRRADTVVRDDDVLCSCHFREGEDKPSLFEWTKTQFVSPEKRKRARRNRQVSVPPNSDDGNSISQDSEGAPPTPLREEELKREIAELNVKLQQLSEANIVLSAQNSSMSSSIPPLTYSSIKGSKYVHYYTGLNEETYEQLMLWLLRFELQYAQKWQVVNVGKEDQLLLTMMKLRCNFDFTDLAFRFQVSRTTVSNIFHTWLQALHEVLFVPFLNKIPSTRKNKESLPASFSDSKFTCCRIVVDCTEMACVMSRTSMDSNSRTFSNYKHRHTFKFLIGCSPGGVITFVSDAYPGNTSDKKIFGDCGLTDQLVAGDMVLVDKGFMVNDLVPQGVSVNMPPFLVGKQFTRQEVKLTYEIARARIIIERVNERVKNYNILDKFPTYLRPHASQILQVVCALVNFQNPLIADTQECEKDEAEIGAEEENENNNVQ